MVSFCISDCTGLLRCGCSVIDEWQSGHLKTEVEAAEAEGGEAAVCGSL